MRTEKNFECEAMSHDLFSTKFCRDGKVDTLSRTDYKEPPVVAYRIPQENLDESGMHNTNYVWYAVDQYGER